jgi:UDP-N-acetylglucosamine diphosphorylase/glucosamine-1-phosphate N-acetyltransferase
MSIVLFDGLGHTSLQPLTLTRPVSHLRVGILTIREKWAKVLGEEVGVRTKDYLSAKFEGNEAQCDLGIAAGLLPSEDLVEYVKGLKDGQILMKDGEVLALKPFPAANANMDKVLKGSTILEYDQEVSMVKRPWDIFRLNGQELEADFALLTAGRESQPLHESNTLIGEEENIFIEEGAEVYASIFNVVDGPIYIGKDAKVLEGSMVRGGLALCDHAVLKMGAKIYGPTTVGPHSKVGGEVGNSVLIGYSNKGHDGYLGNSVLGEWCNLGADTNTSNLKNNYSNVRAYSYLENEMIETGLQFCGLIMGDHSKSSINTMFNTGTVVGVCANVFDGGFPAKHVPSFSWGGKGGFETFKLEKAFEVAERVMARRKIDFTEEDQKILTKISET